MLNGATFQRDIPVLQGTILVLTLIFVPLDLLVDLIQTTFDPGSNANQRDRAGFRSHRHADPACRRRQRRRATTPPCHCAKRSHHGCAELRVDRDIH